MFILDYKGILFMELKTARTPEREAELLKKARDRNLEDAALLDAAKGDKKMAEYFESHKAKESTMLSSIITTMKKYLIGSPTNSGKVSSQSLPNNEKDRGRGQH